MKYIYVQRQDFNDKQRFIYNFLDELVFSKIQGDIFVAGGFFRKFFNEEFHMESDIDLYFGSNKTFADTENYLKANGGKVEFDGENGLKIKTSNGHTFDLIKHCYPDPTSVIQSFDYTVCACALSRDGFHHVESYFDDLRNKEIKLNHQSASRDRLARLQKYVSKGYLASPDTLHQIALNVIKYKSGSSGFIGTCKLTDGNGVWIPAGQVQYQDRGWVALENELNNMRAMPF